MIWTWLFRSCNDVRMSFIKTRDGDDRNAVGPRLFLTESVRTASGSDRIIFHLSFFIYHRPFEGLICHRAMSDNEQMKNAK